MKTIACVVLMVSAASAMAAPALFLKPLHLVERVDDPFAGRTRTVDEYCFGNRIVTVAGQRVTILDYDAQTITLIDHGRGTYSVSRFDEIANAHPKVAMEKASATLTPRITANGVKSSRGGRSVDSFSIEVPHTRVEIGVDRSVTLSRAAVEALIGAGYPNARRPEHDAILGAAGPAGRGRLSAESADRSGSDALDYALPAERAVTIDSEGGPITMRTSVLRFDAELAPQSAVIIDPGAKLVESPTARFAREMKEADTIPVAPRP